jgi:hypothetical protein
MTVDAAIRPKSGIFSSCGIPVATVPTSGPLHKACMLSE